MEVGNDVTEGKASIVASTALFNTDGSSEEELQPVRKTKTSNRESENIFMIPSLGIVMERQTKIIKNNQN